MKKYLVGLASVFALVALVAIPVHAANNPTGGASAPVAGANSAAAEKKAAEKKKKDATKCTANAKTLTKINGDLEYIKNTYYVAPTEFTHYPLIKGVRSAVHDGKGTEKDRKGKVNYGIVMLRFDGALGYFSDIKLLKGGQSPAFSTAELKKFSDKNDAIRKEINKQIKAIDAAKDVLKYQDCSQPATQKIAAEKLPEQKRALTKVKKDVKQNLRDVYNKTKTARGDYQALEKKRKNLVKKKQISDGRQVIDEDRPTIDKPTQDAITTKALYIGSNLKANIR